MKMGHKPAPPRCALASVQINHADAEQAKRDGWNKHGILVVKQDDPRLGWFEQKCILEIGMKLYGRAP